MTVLLSPLHEWVVKLVVLVPQFFLIKSILIDFFIEDSGILFGNVKETLVGKNDEDRADH